MDPRVYLLADGSSSTDAHQKVQSYSIVDPKHHLAIKSPNAIDPVVLDVCHVVIIFLLFVIRFGVVTKIALHPHLVIVGEFVEGVRKSRMLPH